MKIDLNWSVEYACLCCPSPPIPCLPPLTQVYEVHFALKAQSSAGNSGYSNPVTAIFGKSSKMTQAPITMGLHALCQIDVTTFH